MARRLASVAVAAGLMLTLMPNGARAALSFVSIASRPSQAAFPNAVAIDSENDDFYTIDTNTHEVVKFHMSRIGIFWVSRFESRFGADRGLLNPRGIAFGNDRIYVSSSTNEVFMFDPNASFIGKWGSPGQGNGQFDTITSIAVDPFGFVYVVDARNQRVQKFTPEGDYVSQFGSGGTGDGQFSLAALGIAIDGDGNIYVSDEALHRVQKFSPSGTFITKWGGQGSEKGQLNFPDELAVDKDGNILVAESGGPRVQRFTPNGESLGFFTGTGQQFPGEDGGDEFNSPHGIAADDKGRVLVASSGESLIYLYDDLEPQFIIKIDDSGPRAVREERIQYKVAYTQSFESCTGSAAGRVSLPPPVNDSFAVSGRFSVPSGPMTGDDRKPVQFKLEPNEIKMLSKTFARHKTAELNMTFKFDCSDGVKQTVRRRGHLAWK